MRRICVWNNTVIQHDCSTHIPMTKTPHDCCLTHELFECGNVAVCLTRAHRFHRNWHNMTIEWVIQLSAKYMTEVTFLDDIGSCSAEFRNWSPFPTHSRRFKKRAGINICWMQRRNGEFRRASDSSGEQYLGNMTTC